MDPSTLSVSTWNVLADCYAHRSAEVGDNGPIAWKNRSQLIAKCLRECNTDVMCLQEVDHYEDFYKKCLTNLGYRPCFVQRPERQDGCLIAFKNDKFELVDLVQVSCDDAISADSLYEYQKYVKHNVALIVQLRDRVTQKEVIICTCHVHWNPQLPEVKMSQIAHILQKLNEFRDGDLPVVLTGDFNTLPSDPIYAAITTNTNSTNTNTTNTANNTTTPNVPNNITLLQEMLQNVRYGGALYGPATRFLCDASLSKLCKWLRVLGVNCALDSWDNGVPASSTKHRNAAKWQWTSTSGGGSGGTSGTGGAIGASNGTGTSADSKGADLTANNADTATTCVDNIVDVSSSTPPTPTPTLETVSELGTPTKAGVADSATPTPLTPKEAHRAQFPVSGDPTYAARVQSINTFFARAEREKRVILTTSRSLRERASCPKSFFVQAQKLEQGLIDICVLFGLDLTRDRFLTVCGKCGDDVEEVSRTIGEDGECVVHDERLVDKYMPTDRTVFACVNCAQPYWWNEKAGSLPALAMERAEQLYSMVCAGIDKKNGVVSSGASSSGGGGNGNVYGVIATPVMYQDNTATDTTDPTATTSSSDTAIATTTNTTDTTTTNPNTTTTVPTTNDNTTVTTTTTTTKVPLSPPFQPKKAIPQAGTCILKDFGRTAKNPTLKNLAVNSTSVDGSGGGSGGSSGGVGSRSNSKSAELELETIRLGKMTISDSNNNTSTSVSTSTSTTPVEYNADTTTADNTVTGSTNIITPSDNTTTSTSTTTHNTIYENGFILNPFVLSPTHTIADFDVLRKAHKLSAVAITSTGTVGDKLVGLVSIRDTNSTTDRSECISSVMTTIDKLVTATYPITVEHAYKLLKDSKKTYLPLVDENGNLVAFGTRAELKQNKVHPWTTKGSTGSAGDSGVSVGANSTGNDASGNGATATTTTTTCTSSTTSSILTSNTPSMSITALDVMFGNRERTMKLKNKINDVMNTSDVDGSSDGVEGVSASTSNTELNDLCNSSSTSSVEGIALQSVYQLHARNTTTATTAVTTTTTTNTTTTGNTNTSTDTNNSNTTTDPTTSTNTTTTITTIGASTDTNTFNIVKSIKGVNCEPELTNWNGAFKATLDYIFVSDQIKLVTAPAVLPTVLTTSPDTNTSVSGGSSSVSTGSGSGRGTSTGGSGGSGGDDGLLSQVLTQAQPSAQWPSDHFIVTATLQY